VVNMVNIKHENGEISQVDITEDVGQSIINLVGPKADQYAIVFMGKKLQIGIKFSDVEFLDDTHIVRIVKQSVRENDDTTANKKRVKELIFSCTNMLRKIENSHDVGSHVKLLTYTGEKFNEIIKHEPILVEQYNSKSFDLIFDFRLLMFVLTEHDESLYQFPQVLLVFKKALEYALAKNPSDEPSNNFPVPSLPATSSQSIITPQMLASALASAAAGTSGNVRASTNIPSIIQQPSMSGNVFLILMNRWLWKIIDRSFKSSWLI